MLPYPAGFRRIYWLKTVKRTFEEFVLFRSVQQWWALSLFAAVIAIAAHAAVVIADSQPLTWRTFDREFAIFFLTVVVVFATGFVSAVPRRHYEAFLATMDALPRVQGMRDEIGDFIETFRAQDGRYSDANVELGAIDDLRKRTIFCVRQDMSNEHSMTVKNATEIDSTILESTYAEHIRWGSRAKKAVGQLATLKAALDQAIANYHAEKSL